MFVGEQPGDQEDLAGRPFVGPAGLLLDRALEEAGIDRGGLRHQRGEALQVRAARQTAHPQDTRGAGDPGLSVLARCRAGAMQPKLVVASAAPPRARCWASGHHHARARAAD